MNVEEFRAQLEEDQIWRRDEIRFLQNLAARIDSKEDQDQFRRAIILLLYAHFEGFCKFAFTLYINAINGIRITCGEANYAIAAASLANLFEALREPFKKCNEFRKELPNDTKLHRFAMDREFVKRAADFAEQLVCIPDDVVDMESNLKPVVLRKNLYRLGLPHDQFKSLEGKIHCLLELRNSIAHGAAKKGVELNTYESLRDTTFTIMDEITRGIMNAFQNKLYLRACNC